ncbi:MAG: amino acid-binding protein [Chloroflexi bacterium]|nr:amino acid-binding protein [Chloroflexota bacterium]
MAARIKQVSVFIENQPGRLTSMLEALEKNGIDIRALSIGDTADFGIVRMILSDAAKGAEALRQAGFTTRQDWILSAEIPDRPGGLLKAVAEPLAKAGVNLKYLYFYIEAAERKSMAVLKVDDLEKAEQVLRAL